MSNICIGADTIATASHTPSIVSSTDEGGFNEPSPEIKAKLKPVYTFEASPAVAKEIEPANHFNEDDYNAHQHSLHYVDFGYRLNPDGSESKQCFSEETEQYAIARNAGLDDLVTTSVNNGVHRSDKKTIHYPVGESVVYASIKSEPSSLSPPSGQKFNCDSKAYQTDDFQNDDSVSDVDEKFEQIYTSNTNDAEREQISRLADGDSSFNIDNVEYADASDKEDLPDAMTAYEADRLLSSRFVAFYLRFQSM